MCGGSIFYETEESIFVEGKEINRNEIKNITIRESTDQELLLEMMTIIKLKTYSDCTMHEIFYKILSCNNKEKTYDRFLDILKILG